VRRRASDTHVHYDRGVPPDAEPTKPVKRRVNRAAWANVVQQLLDETGDAKNQLAAKVGVAPRTVSRWLGLQMDVSERGVRAVAEAYDRQPLEMLVKVGYYLADEVTIVKAPRRRKPVDEEVAIIMSAQVSRQTKQLMLERLAELRTADKLRRINEINSMIRLAGGST